MALTWTNTSKTDLILPHGTVVPAGVTVLDRLETEFDQMKRHALVDHLIDTGVLKKGKDASPSNPAVVSLFNGGPVPNSANIPSLAPAAAAPASDPGPGSNPPVGKPSPAAPQIVKSSDGTHEVLVEGSVIASGLTRKEAMDLAADPKKTA